MAWPLSQDYNEAIQDPQSSFSDPELRAGEATTNALGMPMPRSGNFADVYEFNTPATNSKWAIKCFTRHVLGLRERYTEISAALLEAKLPFAVEFQYLVQGIRIKGDWFPILKMRWIEGLLLNELVRENLDKPAVLGQLGTIWGRMAKRLREGGIAHADLQHGNVILVPGSKAGSLAVKLIDYDGMFVPALASKKSGEVGHPNYQHPQRLREGIYTAEVDRFPLLVVATALRALTVGGLDLWNRYDNGDNLLFRESDLKAPGKSALFTELHNLADPQARMLAEALHKAAEGNLVDVPKIDELLPEPKRAPAPEPVKAASAVETAVTAEAPPIPAATTVASSPLDFTEPEATPRRTAVKRGGIPLWAWLAGGGVLAAVSVVVLGIAVGLFFFMGRDGNKNAQAKVDDGKKLPKDGGNPKPPPIKPIVDPNKGKVEPAQPEKIKNKIGMEFARIPKGKAWLGGGGGKPGDTEIEILEDFYLGVFEVTQEEWKNIVGNNPSSFNAVAGVANEDQSRFPVEKISWGDTQLFLAKLNELDKQIGWHYRLPSEAEWEYACRGGPTADRADSAFDYYIDKPTNQLLPAQANFDHGKALKRTCKVGSFSSNRLGLFDMHGNVWEWCDDAVIGGKGEPMRVFRGGSWDHVAANCRASYRMPHDPAARYFSFGLRVARVPDGKQIAKVMPGKPPDAGPPVAFAMKGKVQPEFIREMPNALRVQLSADGQYVAYSISKIGTFAYRDGPAFNKETVVNLEDSTSILEPAASFPDGKSMVFIGEVKGQAKLLVWDWEEKKFKASMPTQKRAASVVVSPDMKYLLAYLYQPVPNAEHWVALYDVATRKEVKRWQSDPFVATLGFTPDSKTAFFGDRKKPALAHAVLDGAPAPMPALPIGFGSPHAFSPDFNRVATISPTILGHFELTEKMKYVGGVKSPDPKIHFHGVAYSPDNKLLLVGIEDMANRPNNNGRGALLEPRSGAVIAVTDPFPNVPFRAQLASNGIAVLDGQNVKPRLYRFPIEAPPVVAEGFEPIFNNKNLAGWNVSTITDGNDWKVEGGILVGSASRPNSTICTLREFKNVHLRVEMRYRPDTKANVYVWTQANLPLKTQRHGFYALINDRRDNKELSGAVGMDGPTGGGKVGTGRPLPPDQWFVLEIIAEEDRVSIKLDGKMVSATSDAAKRFPRSGAVAFSILNKGGGVEIRKVEIKDLGGAGPLPVAKADGFVPLFNGKDLDGWKKPTRWRVVDGVLTGFESGSLVSAKAYTDFHLRLEGRISDKGTANVMFRGPESSPEIGYFATISANAPSLNKSGSLSAFKVGENIVNLISFQAELHKPGQWFDMEIIVQKKRILIKVNGQKTVDVEEARYPEFSGGPIVVGTHPQTTMEFKKFEIKELQADPKLPVEPPNDDKKGDEKAGLVGTTWTGTETLPGYGALTFKFTAPGEVTMTDTDGSSRGTFVRTGNDVNLKFGEATYKGIIEAGTKMRGNASNAKTKWTWTVTRQGGGKTNAGDFVPLFNGKDLAGWKPSRFYAPGTWRVEGNLLVGASDDKKGGMIHTALPQPRDFHLRMELRVAAKSSQIWFRAPENEHGGYESILTTSPTGSRAGDIRAQLPGKNVHVARSMKVMPVNQWFTFEIIAKERKLITKIDGEVTVDIEDDKVLTPGHFKLMHQPGARIEFKKIEIKALKTEAAPPTGGVKRFPAIVPQPSKGIWRVEGDELVMAGVTTAELFFGDPKWADYEFEVQAKRTGGNEAFSLVWRRSAENSLYFYRIGVFKGGIIAQGWLDGGVSGQTNTKDIKDKPLQSNVWYAAKISVRGDKGECYFDGVKIFDFKADKHAAGAVGIMALNASFRFKNIKVTAPDGTVLLEGMPDLTAVVKKGGAK